MDTLFKTDFGDMIAPRRGKVRDIYELDLYLLIVATDRISAFDVIMNEPIPNKGRILSQISVFWFQKTKHIVPNHFLTNKVQVYPKRFREFYDQLESRSMLVQKCRPIELECIVRGYITGSAWKEYQETRKVCGIELPAGLKEFERLPKLIFTPSTKAAVGHDENITFHQAAEIAGMEVLKKLETISLKLYTYAHEYLENNNVILADTKFEFGTNENNDILLIDEALTPDSSRFWLKEDYAPDKPQYNFDKQVLRDYLETLKWNKKPPPPTLPYEIIQKTSERYQEAYDRIVK